MQNKFLCTFLLLSTSFLTLKAQSPTDGLMMPQHQICVLGNYTSSTWDEYWEGTNKRRNLNLGTFTASNVMAMANYGITDRLNVMAGLPYIKTKSDSYLKGQQGLQDLAAWLKYQPLSLATGPGKLKGFVTGGFSIPVSNYVNDLLPLSIGLHCPTASLRAIFNYTLDFGLYSTVQAGHAWRGRTKIDRDSYLYNNKLYYTNEVPVPNIFDASARIGFIKTRFQTELWIERIACVSGDDIRYNDAPFPTNKMTATAIGWFGKVFVTKQWALQTSISQVLNGRNTGQAITWSAGTSYFFTVGE
jgi:hypothetical protein